MANVNYVPICKFALVDATGVTIDYTNFYGAWSWINLGANECWGIFNAAGTTIVQADTAGQFRMLVGMPMGIPRAALSKIGFRCAAGLTTTVQIIATPEFED